MTVQILRAADRPATTWKNGGGETREIAAAPPGANLGTFDWRVSLATVAQAGPFSIFPGVDRTMMVLEGRLELVFADGRRMVLDEAGAPEEFAADIAVRATLPERPVTDLNVMVRRGVFTASLARRAISGAAAVVCQDVTLLLCRSPAIVTMGVARHSLVTDDVVRVDAARGAVARIQTTGEIAIAHLNAGG